jgi:glycerol-3-phosphate acyltransferase PlsX
MSTARAEHLLQFAVMGSALVAAVQGNENPTVGLLNIGEEAIKGSETIKRAGELLRAAAGAGHINFIGNVEGNDIFKGTTDIVVCDGFVGNVRSRPPKGWPRCSRVHPPGVHPQRLHKLAALVALPVLKRFKARVDPAATTARRCWACAAWCSRATARPTPGLRAGAEPRV